MKLPELVSVFLKEDKHFPLKQGQNFILNIPCYWAQHANLNLVTFHFVVGKWVTEHVIMLKEIFDKEDSIF